MRLLNICSDELCTGCGTCAGICPLDAIVMDETDEGLYRPAVNSNKCSSCGICAKVCPSVAPDFSGLNNFVFNKSPQDSLLGNYINCYLGFSTDRFLRWNSSSGGLVTTLLKFAIDEKIIDGAVVVRMSSNNPLRPEVFLAKDSEEILSSLGAKYCPTPANVMLKDILSEDGKFAVVGLPCHIQGIRKAEILNKKLREKIVLHLGLFCSHTVDFRGTDFILRKLGVQKNDVLRIEYRGRGWPGILAVKLKNGKALFLPYKEYYIFRYFFFTPLACTLCYDCTAEFADISFGDPWLPELKKERMGKSIIVSRSEIGENILQAARMKNRVAIKNIPKETVIKSQRENIIMKKKTLENYIQILSMLRKTASYCQLKPPSRQLALYGVAMLPLIGILSTSNRFVLKILEHLPLSFFGAYNKLISTVGKAFFCLLHI